MHAWENFSWCFCIIAIFFAPRRRSYEWILSQLEERIYEMHRGKPNAFASFRVRDNSSIFTH